MSTIARKQVPAPVDRTGLAADYFGALSRVAVTPGGISLAALATLTSFGVEIYRLEKGAKARRPTLFLPVDQHYGWVHGSGDGPVTGTVCVLGDSLAWGYGASDRHKTLGALIVNDLVHRKRAAGQPDARMRLQVLARSGARSAALADQVELALREQPELAVIVIGANEYRGGFQLGQAVRHLEQAVLTLSSAGCAVVVGTCPDLGVPPLAPLWRWTASKIGEHLALEQEATVIAAGGLVVDLRRLAPQFRDDVEGMYCSDRVHPNDKGYRVSAATFLPVTREALGLGQRVTQPVAPQDMLVDPPRAGQPLRPAPRSRSRYAGVRTAVAAPYSAATSTLGVVSPLLAHLRPRGGRGTGGLACPTQ